VGEIAVVSEIQQAGAGDVLTVIVVVIGVAVFGVAKWRLGQQTKCIHCGHDNGLSGHQAAICPACGRNKTVFNSKKARKS
jgi:hypothetical protein